MAEFTKEQISKELDEIAINSLKSKAIKILTDQAHIDKKALIDQIATIDKNTQAEIEKIK